MEKDKNALTARVAQLEQTAADHERRIAALERRSKPNVKKPTPATSLDAAMDEFLDGMLELDAGKEME